MNTRKFALHAGYVVSISDGDQHYVGIVDLAMLYQLNPNEYIAWSQEGRGLNPNDYTHLYPRLDGQYGRPSL